MRTSITYNNLNSWKDLNLSIEDITNIPVPERNINIIEVEGREDPLTEDLETFKPLEFPPLNFVLVDKRNIKESCRRIRKWLIGTINDNKLFFSDDGEYFYKVKRCTIGNIERELKFLGRFAVNFITDPYQYTLDGLEIRTLTSKPAVLFNDGYKCRPVIKIYGSGNITFSIGSQTIQLNNISEFITIDSMAREAISGLENANNKMIGAFPLLEEDENNITWTGTVTKVEIIPNFRYL